MKAESSTPAAFVFSTETQVLAARIVSSIVGSGITALAVHPLEVIKVKTQSTAATPFGNSSSSTKRFRGGVSIPCPHVMPNCSKKSGASSSVTRPRRGMATTAAHGGEVARTVSMARYILRTEGYTGLYRGLQPTLVMAFPSNVVYYTLYDGMAEHFRRESGASSGNNSAASWWNPLLAGGGARLVSSTVTAPLEFLRTIQAASSSRRAPTSMWLQLWKLSSQEQGLSTLFRGIGPTLARDVPFSAIYWLCVEKLREHQLPSSMSSPMAQLATDFTHGTIAGMMGAIFTTPADVVKTRMQTMQLKAASKTKSTKAHSAWSVLRGIVKEEGAAGIWRGSVARISKVAPACGIMITSYEFGKRLLLPDEVRH